MNEDEDEDDEDDLTKSALAPRWAPLLR